MLLLLSLVFLVTATGSTAGASESLDASTMASIRFGSIRESSGSNVLMVWLCNVAHASSKWAIGASRNCSAARHRGRQYGLEQAGEQSKCGQRE